jgi:hypothetical protein
MCTCLRLCVCVCACVHVSEMCSQKEDPHTNSSNQVICSAWLRVSVFVCMSVTLSTRMTIIKRTGVYSGLGLRVLTAEETLTAVSDSIKQRLPPPPTLTLMGEWTSIHWNLDWFLDIECTYNEKTGH